MIGTKHLYNLKIAVWQFVSQIILKTVFFLGEKEEQNIHLDLFFLLVLPF